MAEGQSELKGPDLTEGVPLAELADGGMMLGHAGGEAVLLARRGEQIFAIGATCTHYSGPLAEGLMVDETVRCPWHHACFSLRTGEALRAPALHPVPSWRVERRGDDVYVTEKKDRDVHGQADAGEAEGPINIVIVGAGAAGDAAAEMLRRRGFSGGITLIGADEEAPYDRPNLSKDYLAGNAPEEWLPLRSPSFYEENEIDLVLETRVTRIDPDAGRVETTNGTTYEFDRLLLATGAEPVHLPIEGTDQPHVYYLRTRADCEAIIAQEDPGSAVVIGAGFIGMEVAASLRTRDIDVHLVAPESRPLENVIGPELGAMLQSLHEEHGVMFHLENTVESIGSDSVTLSDGTEVAADLVVIGIGVRPSTRLAKQAGLETDNGVKVDEFLETSRRGIFAAGDVARWPDPRSPEREGIRVEHWIVAQRLGQIAAVNMIGQRRPFDAVPFFWTRHYDMSVTYLGHATEWDRTDVAGSVEDRDCLVAFRKDGKTLAVAGVGRGLEMLEAEAAMERGDEAALGRLIPTAE